MRSSILSRRGLYAFLASGVAHMFAMGALARTGGPPIRHEEPISIEVLPAEAPSVFPGSGTQMGDVERARDAGQTHRSERPSTARRGRRPIRAQREPVIAAAPVGEGGAPSVPAKQAPTQALFTGLAAGSAMPGPWNPGAYSGRVLARIEAAKRYPEEARAFGAAGAAVVRFAVGRSGELARVLLARSSGVAAIDRGALDAVRNAAPFGPPPNDAPTLIWLEVRVRFDLTVGEELE